jgi:putative transposase
LGIFANIELSEFVALPNHIHGIIWIMGEGCYRIHPGTWKDNNLGRGGQLSTPAEIAFETLSNVVGAFKTKASSRINKLRGVIGVPVWQKSFYDRIVQSEFELEYIYKYIQHNPVQRTEDRDNPSSPKYASSAGSMDDYRNEIFHS